MRGGNKHGNERGRPRDRGDIAYASGIALRLREHMRCTYFSCRARFGVFIGLVCARALSLLEHESRKNCGSCSRGFIGPNA